MTTPFERSEYVAQYEAWYTTPFGRIADELERRMIDELLAPLEPGALLLEIGCGTAHFGLALAQQGLCVVGCDPAHAMLSAAQSRVPPLAGLVQADGMRLPFASETFDAALLVAVLEFVTDPVALITEARRVARRRVVVVTVNRWSYLALRRSVAGWRGHPVFAAARYRSCAQLEELARAAEARVERTSRALYLPPALAGHCAPLERRLAAMSLSGAGIVGLALNGGSA